MCYENDAKNWTGLTDISNEIIPANGILEISIAENLSATHIAISHIYNGKRYITYADQLTENYTMRTYCNEINANLYQGLSMVGKNGSNWILKITNNTTTTNTYYYSGSLCNQTNATGWIGLANISLCTLSPGSSENIVVSENGSASYVAISYISNMNRMITYACSLNTNTTMTVNNIVLAISPYLEIENKGHENNYWMIRITNNLPYSLTVTYNEKMCFDGDAQGWVNLSDKINTTILSGLSKEVKIYDNFFATTIAISYYRNGTRYVTYANNLNANGTMSVYNISI